jgi:8-oxo-dGTP diphosphatase
MHVVVGIIINSQQEIFIAKRPPDKYKGGLWEFPGGKVELHETILQALKRELKEEIGIEVLAAKPWIITQHNYGDRFVELNVLLVTDFTGEPQGKEGQEIAWVSKNALSQFEFPEGNKKILAQLLLPTPTMPLSE